MSESNEDRLPLLALRYLAVRRFRSLEDVGPLRFQDEITVLTGENDSGKTATLDALELLLGSGSVDTEDQSHWASAEDGVEVEGGFCELARPDGVEVRVRARWQPGGALTREILDRVHRGFGARPTDLPINDLRAKFGELGIESPGGQAKGPFIEAADSWIQDRPDEEFEERWRPATREELNRLPRFTRFTSVEAPSPAAHVQGVIDREARRLLKEEPYARQLMELGERLDSEIAPSLERVRERIHAYCPDLDDIEVVAGFDFGRPSSRVVLRVRRGGESVDLEKVGEGRKRKLALAVHEANLSLLEEGEPDAVELIAYDEPDTHLDYAGQRSLFDILRRQGRLPHIQVLVATHSMNFMDRVSLQSILHFRLQGDLRTQVEVLPGEAHEDELRFLGSVCAGLGLRNSVLLDERVFLVVEGETEEAAVPELYRVATGRSLTSAGVTLFNTRGSRSVRKLVEILISDWRRRVVVLADEDAREELLPWCQELGLREGSEVFFIGARDFEDAFEDGLWVKALQQQFMPKSGGDEWTESELDSLRRGENPFGRALRDLVRRRCADHTIGKPDLGLALANAINDSEDMPSVLRSCFECLVAEGSPDTEVSVGERRT